MFQDSLPPIADACSGERATALATDLWGFDHWFDFTHFKRSADYCAARLEEAGLSAVECISFTADGRTCYGDWVAPLAWDVSEAELRIVAPETLSPVRYSDSPCALVMWSAPTPPQGIEAEVVWLDDPRFAGLSEASPDTRLRGKLIFTSRHAGEAKRLATRHGAAGVITDHHAVYGGAQFERPLDKISWMNLWTDDPNGWPFVAGDTLAFGFVLSARQGDRLRHLLRGGQPVQAWARVDSRLYDGTFDLVTGVIPGQQSEEEVLVFAHLYEVGAQDNAGGCAVVLEAARCLNNLIVSGRLPAPRRSIRFVLSWEIYGLLAYRDARPEAMGRIIAGLNLDSLGIPPLRSGARLRIHANPHAQASYTDVLIQRIAEQILPPGEWAAAPFDTTDAVIADPAIGIPTPWLGEMTSQVWHSSLDTPEKLDPRTLEREGVVTATYLYVIANAGGNEACWLADEVVREYAGRLVKATEIEADLAAESAWHTASRRLGHVRECGRHALRSCAQVDASPSTCAHLNRLERHLDSEYDRMREALAAALARRAGNALWTPPTGIPLSAAEAEAARLVPRRTVAGGLSLGRLSPDHRAEAVCVTGGENPRWSRALCCALYWCDGRRSMLEVRDRLEQEVGPLSFDLFEYFRFLSRHGYLQLDNGTAHAPS